MDDAVYIIIAICIVWYLFFSVSCVIDGLENLTDGKYTRDDINHSVEGREYLSAIDARSKIKIKWENILKTNQNLRNMMMSVKESADADKKVSDKYLLLLIAISQKRLTLNK